MLNPFDLSIKKRIGNFNKTIEVDSDKSLSIRSFLIGAICQKVSSVKNVLESDDVLSTISCLRKLGVKIKKVKLKNYIIFGNGLGSLNAEKNTSLNFGNSGTLSRLLIGILSTTPGLKLNVHGDHSLNKRNMKKLINLMSEFGATFEPKNKINFPLKIISSQMPVGINYKAGVSAQLKSAVMLAGLNSYGRTTIIENNKSRDHTENMLLSNSQAIKIKEKKNKVILIEGKNQLSPIDVIVPGDPSSAAFFVALTLLNQKSSLIIKNVGLNKTRTGFYQILKNQKAKLKFINLKKINNEIRGDIVVKSCKIKPFKVNKSFYVNSTDEYPILFVIAALTNGTSTFKGIDDLVNKESNRIVEMQKILKQIGVRSKFTKKILSIYGKGPINASNKIVNVPNLGDHRICMSSFILATLTGANLRIKNFETVNTSSPSFLKIVKSLGAKFEIKKKL